jgi:hypothetical protein
VSTSLEARFEEAMRRIDEEAGRRCPGYDGRAFRGLVTQYGGVEAARRLLRAERIHDGFTDLVICGCSDLTAEALALRPEFESLFTDVERAEAARRLQG